MTESRRLKRVVADGRLCRAVAPVVVMSKLFSSVHDPPVGAVPQPDVGLTIDVVIRVWRDLPTLRDPDRFPVWVRRIMTNRCRDALRAQRRSLVVALEPALVGRASIGDPAATVAERTDLDAVVVLGPRHGLGDLVKDGLSLVVLDVATGKLAGSALTAKPLP